MLYGIAPRNQGKWLRLAIDFEHSFPLIVNDKEEVEDHNNARGKPSW
jgi:hypothetical protein